MPEPTPPQPDVDADLLVAMLRTHFSSPSYRPPLLPQAAMEILPLAQKPALQFEEVVGVLEKDPVLAARVLSLAQSAFYAARSPIRSLHQAAMRLGLKILGDLVLEAALNLKVFRAPGYDRAMERLSRHSSATAHVVRMVCQRTLVDGEYAFLCGLLHDVGFAAACLALAEDPPARGLDFDRLGPVLDEVHQEASGFLARAWKLPEAIRETVATHHEVAPGGAVRPVNAALVVAEQLVWEAGLGMLPPPEDADPMAAHLPEPPLDGIDANWTGAVEEARRALGMDELGLCAARAEAFALLERLGMRGGAGRRAPAALRR